MIPLYDDSEKLEAQLRYALSQIRRDSRDIEQVIMIDTGLGEDCQKICEKLVWGLGGVYICEYDGLPEMISKLDNLQNGVNDVE